MGGALNSQLQRAGVAFAPLFAAQAAQTLDHGVSPMEVDAHDIVVAHEGFSPLPGRCQVDLHAAAGACSASTSSASLPGQLACLASAIVPQQLPTVLSFQALHDELQGNASLQYPPQEQPVLMDCMQSTDMQIAQAVLMSTQRKQGTGPAMYWLVPVRQSAKFMSLLADFRVVHRSTEGSGKDFLLLANVP
jgi:hypothetical protein